MDFYNDIGKQIEAWRLENEENRAAVVLLIERQNVQQESCDYATEGCVLGYGDIITDTICHIIDDKENKSLGFILRKCMGRVLLRRVAKRLSKDVDNLNTTIERLLGGEEKEASKASVKKPKQEKE